MPKHKNWVSQVLDVGSVELTEEIIRHRAYQLFEERGCQHGYDLDDWLQAEAEIMGKSQNRVSVNEDESPHEPAVIREPNAKKLKRSAPVRS